MNTTNQINKPTLSPSILIFRTLPPLLMMNKSLISPGSAPLDSSGSTSPDNTIHFPPSPSSSKTMRVSANVAKVIQLFRKHRDGKLEQSWIKTRLHADEYEELNILLERREPLYNYVNDKVGYEDYFAISHEVQSANN